MVRREERPKALADEIGNGKVAYLKSDVRNFADMQALIKVAKNNFGHIDVLYANAGVMPAGPMSQLKIDEWMSIVDINIKGVLTTLLRPSSPNLRLKRAAISLLHLLLPA